MEAFKNKDHITYHLQNKEAQAYATNTRITGGCYHFDAVIKDNQVKDVVLNMGGMHNIENAIAAITVAKHLGIEDEKIKEAVAGFKGVKRRFEYIVKLDKLVYIDDYAHHPEELRALLTGAKSLFPGLKCTMVFQPHLYSRTRDLAAGFAESLDLADEIILLPIYPAREMPMEGVTSDLILGQMKNENKSIKTMPELMSWISTGKIELIITAGAGDIDTLVEPIKRSLEEKYV
jgi:UDP-N-acetylmuramate--alanine ligase